MLDVSFCDMLTDAGVAHLARVSTLVRAGGAFNSNPTGINSISTARLHMHPMGFIVRVDELVNSRK